ncbi:hypothetical protein C8A05DRAFT_41196 [Staphylotrichum tortipilum]|uniref:Uncharacterized protein n=1 Tax=Staphylotrichum tortipilum TaxID=2831512 RepID=A0AAN6RXL9_9PEZI|nr:hypothetical protein C8A05DRAFT_41196 [Staphylotrichum longicolle]
MDNAFLQIFRPHLISKNPEVLIPVGLLTERIDKMQRTRDAYYAAESEYEVMESRMDTLELELDILQYNLSNPPQGSAELKPRVPAPPPLPHRPPPPAVDDLRTIVLPDRGGPSYQAGASLSPLSIDLLGILGNRPDDIHPLYEELLQAAGDCQAAKEYVEELEMNRETVLFDLELELHRKRVREGQGNHISENDLLSLRTSLARVPTNAAEFEAGFGIPITEDQLQVLRDYELSSDRALRELDATTDALTYLRDLCVQKGVMRKNPSYHEELAIWSSLPGWTPMPHDGNMAIDPPPRPPLTSSFSSASSTSSNPPSLANPRFPILLSNPSHVLALDTVNAALDRAMRLPKDDPAAALRRAECVKELGISQLMLHAENTPDYINQWLIHRLRTSPLEAELLLAVCEDVFRVVNLRRWQEEVLYHWRLDEAAKMGVELFEGAVTPRGRCWGRGGGGDGGGRDVVPKGRGGE